MTLTVGDPYNALREPIRRVSLSGEQQVRYLVEKHIDADELLNEFEDGYITAHAGLRNDGVLSSATWDGVVRLRTALLEEIFHDPRPLDDDSLSATDLSDGARSLAAAVLDAMAHDADAASVDWRDATPHW